MRHQVLFSLTVWFIIWRPSWVWHIELTWWLLLLLNPRHLGSCPSACLTHRWGEQQWASISTSGHNLQGPGLDEDMKESSSITLGLGFLPSSLQTPCRGRPWGWLERRRHIPAQCFGKWSAPTFHWADPQNFPHKEDAPCSYWHPETEFWLLPLYVHSHVQCTAQTLHWIFLP